MSLYVGDRLICRFGWKSMCSSSGESIVLIWHLVYVTVCWWPSGMQVWVELNGVPILYMFRAPLYSSSGESIVLIHLVYVTVCWWPSGLQVWVELHGVPILYRFRAPLFSSSVESIALIHLVCVTLCRWQSGMQVWVRTPWSSTQTCIPDGHPHRVTHTRCRINTIDSPDDEHRGARIM